MDWKIKSPPKIRLFLWRVIAGAIAVANRLITRGIMVNTMCKMCNLEVETINHVLFQCDRAMQMWEVVGLPTPTAGFGDCLHENMTFVLQQLERQDTSELQCLSIPWILWSIWKSKNKVIFAGVQESVSVLVQRAVEETNCWFELHHDASQNDQNSRVSQETEHRWQKPAYHMVKCNLHGHWKNSQLHSEGSWIVRDFSGSVLFHSWEAFIRSWNRVTDEFQILIWAMKSRQDLHMTKVIFASDCAAVNAALLKPSTWPRYRGFIEEVFRLTAGFDSVEFHLETPKTNQIAREISTSVTRDGRFNSYIARGGPAWLHNLLAREV